MTRLTGTLIDDQVYREGREDLTPQVDLALGGQFGYQANFDAYVSNAGHVPQNVIALLIEPPRGYRYLPDGGDKATAVLKSLIENQSKQITGLNTAMEIETSERPIGTAGHMMREPTRVTETIPTVSHTWDERYGRAIQNFWDWNTRMFIREPGTQQPGIMNVAEEPPTDHLPDMYSFTTLYIEPDPLGRFVTRSWLNTNMFNQSIGEAESTYDPTAGQEVPELSIEFHGIPVRNIGVDRFAQSILENISQNYVNAGPNHRPSFVDQIDRNITAQEHGYVEGLQRDSQTGVSG